MKKGLTIKDISQELGIDRSTVSRIMNRDFSKHRYSAETIKKVEEFVGIHGLRRNRVALSLRNSKTHMIGMVVANLANQHFSKLASSINRELLKHDYKTIIEENPDDGIFSIESIISNLLGYQVDGLILSLSNNPSFDISKLEVPAVFIDNNVFPGYDFVGLDDLKSAELLKEELKAKGHRKVGLVMDYLCQNRLDGFLRTSTLDFELIPPSLEMISTELLETQCQSHLKKGCTALVGLQNTATIAAFKFAVKNNLKIPDDLGIAGIDDFELADALIPAITTVKQPIEKYAEKAVDILMKNIENKRVSSGVECLFPGGLLVRNSL